ncbi:MAG: hypothetical protein ACLPYS_14740 [Vulcanimicrobiaceae bacterium]
MRTRKTEAAHPPDDMLSALADADAGTAALHVAGCAECREKVSAFHDSRRLLGALGEQNRAPHSDLALRAIGLLRARHGTIETMNEVFQAVLALLRGIGDLLSDPHGGGSTRG